MTVLTWSVQVINGAAKTWGLECLRYEIRDIVPPPGIVRAMELQAEAERRKRAQVLESEGVRQATINESEARRVRIASFFLNTAFSETSSSAVKASSNPIKMYVTSQECCGFELFECTDIMTFVVSCILVIECWLLL
jgi:SPFH domain / Band 7 family